MKRNIRMLIHLALILALLGLAQPAAASRQAKAPPPDLSSPIETVLTFDLPVRLTDLAAPLQNSGLVPFRFTTTEPHGVNLSKGSNLARVIADFRTRYQRLLKDAEPLIADVSIRGTVAATRIHPSLAIKVGDHAELNVESTRQQFRSRDAGRPSGEIANPSLATSGTKLWAPEFGKILTEDFFPGQRKIVQEMTWDSQSSIDAFGEEAYEHDFKQFNDANSDQLRPHCEPGEREAFWGTNDGVTMIDDYPANTYPYFDTDALDPCSQQDLSVGIYYPERLEPNVLYRTQLVVDSGNLSTSPFRLAAQKLERVNIPTPFGVCNGNPACVGEDPFDDDPQEGLIKRNEGLSVPSCRDWRKGETSQPCGEEC